MPGLVKEEVKGQPPFDSGHQYRDLKYLKLLKQFGKFKPEITRELNESSTVQIFASMHTTPLG